MFQATRVVSSSSAARHAAPSGLRRHLLTGGTALIAVLAVRARRRILSEGAADAPSPGPEPHVP